VPKSKQPIEGVFAIHVIVRPVAVKPTFIVPESVHEIEAVIAEILERSLESGKSMQSSGC
jgi:hypothetical protein